MAEIEWKSIDCYPAAKSRFMKTAFQGKDYIILENKDKQWKAIRDSCPHAGGKFSQGWCDENHLLTCPLHQFKFDISTGREVTRNGYALSMYDVKVIDEEYFIGLPKKKWWPF